MTVSTTHFRSVLRGYDPAQVDQHVHDLARAAAAARQEAAERTIEVSKLEASHGQLRNEVERHAQLTRAFEEERKKAATPTYATLGDRIGSILTLADEEAHELRARAQADSADHHALADESAAATRRDADHYAAEMRSAADAEAGRFMENAKRQADSLLDDADRQAMARRAEAEAVYERARAKSATAAVDFETTLAARRDSSALEFAAEVTAAEQQLASVRLQSEQAHAESEQAQQEAASRSAQQLDQAMVQAHALVTEAKTKAERIRGDSERELAAATQRRDSINAQLSNVRQMLAALGGTPVAIPLEAAEPAAAQPRTSGTAAEKQGVGGGAHGSTNPVETNKKLTHKDAGKLSSKAEPL
jgi:DivIVA domain-containing protein